MLLRRRACEFHWRWKSRFRTMDIVQFAFPIQQGGVFPGSSKDQRVGDMGSPGGTSDGCTFGWTHLGRQHTSCRFGRFFDGCSWRLSQVTFCTYCWFAAGVPSGDELLLSTSDGTDMKSGAWSLCDCDEKFCSRDELYQRKRDPEVFRFVAEVSGAKQGSHDSWRN